MARDQWDIGGVRISRLNSMSKFSLACLFSQAHDLFLTMTRPIESNNSNYTCQMGCERRAPTTDA
jgi:hypothetical protein